MATIKTPIAGVSPYQEVAAAPVVLRSDANGNTVLANPIVATTAAATAASSATAAANANSTTIINGQEALNRVISTSRTGVFEGANVTINLEEQLFNTTNQVTSTTNYAEGANGSIQYNNGSNGFAGDPYFTYASGNVVTPGIRTNGYFYGNGAPFIGGGNAAIGNFVFTGDNMTISDANSTLSVTGNGTGNVNISANSKTWTFSNDSNLTFPDNSGASWPINKQRFGMGNIGAWLDGQWTIGEFSGNGVSGTVGIRIDPAIEGNTGITIPSQADSTTQPVQIYNTGGGGISLYNGANNWSFNNNGTTQFPGNLLQPPEGNPLDIKVTIGNVFSTVSLYDVGSQLIIQDNTTGPNPAWALFEADLANVNTPQAVVILKPGDTGDEVRWYFDALGNLTLPDIASPSINYANGTPYVNTNKIANGNTYANIEFPSGNLAVGVNIQPVTGAWINTYGNIVANGLNDTVGESVVIDGGGNVYVTGSVYNADFGQDQAYVRKLGPTGTVYWQKALPAAVDGSIFSSGETLAIDGSGNLYWLAILWGGSVEASSLVTKLNSSTGEAIWTTQVSGGKFAYDMTVNAAGQVFVVTNQFARITSLDTNGAVLWSFDPSDGGTSVVDTGTFVIIGYNQGTVAAYDYSGNILWANQVFNTNQAVWGLAWDGTNWYASDVNGNIMKISGADNSTILWQRHINRDGTGGNIFNTWIEYSGGYIYAGGTGNDGSSDSFITVKIDASTGDLNWARALEASSAGQWYWYGHHDISVQGDYYAITGYARPANSNYDQQVLARLPVDGSLAGSTVGPYRYVDVPALTVDTVSIAGTGKTTPTQPAAVSTTSITTLNTLVAPYPEVNILSPFTTGALWSFNNNNVLTLPSGGQLGSSGMGWTGLHGANGYPLDVTGYYSSGNISGQIFFNPGGSINLTAAVDSGNTVEWIFNSDGSLQVPSNSLTPGPGTIAAANGYPTLLAYGSGGGFGIHGGPELDWMNADDPANTFGDVNTLRNTAYLNGSGLYIGMNENSVVGNTIASWRFTPDGNLTLPSGGQLGYAGMGWTGLKSANGTPIEIDSYYANGNISSQIFLTSDGSLSIVGFVDGGASSSWTFNADGNLTVPGPITGYTGGEDQIGGNVLITGGSGSDALYPSFAGGGNANISGGAGRVNARGGNVNILGGVSGNGLADYGNINISTGGYTWTYNNLGDIVFPLQPTNNRTGSGEALVFAKSNYQKVIATAPGDAGQPTVSRLVIAGGDGFESGEGGDIYLWAGQSGFAAGGSGGGDIKVDGGNAINGAEGGTVKIRGGTSYDNGLGAGLGGFIEIYAGSGNIGAPVDILAGQGNSQANSGNVTIQTPYGGQWKFDNYGTLTLPVGGSITGISPAAVFIKAPAGSQAVLTNNSNYNLVVAQDQDVRIVTSPDSGTTFNTWNFLTDGNLTTPGSSGNITGADYISANVFTALANVTVTANAYNWIFDNGGNLTLPTTTTLPGKVTDPGVSTAYNTVSGAPTIDITSGIVYLTPVSGQQPLYILPPGLYDGQTVIFLPAITTGVTTTDVAAVEVYSVQGFYNITAVDTAVPWYVFSNYASGNPGTIIGTPQAVWSATYNCWYIQPWNFD